MRMTSGQPVARNAIGAGGIGLPALVGASTVLAGLALRTPPPANQ